jgi:catechol 2,3-dioxygenase-like lactoylglutathione lyase family enzyme
MEPPAAIDHVGLSVADLQETAGFYGRAFGFRSEFEFELPGAVRGSMLIAPSGMRLELFEAPGSRPGISPQTQIDALYTRGYGHFALAAPDIEPLFERAVGAGARSIVAPSPSPEPGVRFAFLADPEGNLIELVERGSADVASGISDRRPRRVSGR